MRQAEPEGAHEPVQAPGRRGRRLGGHGLPRRGLLGGRLPGRGFPRGGLLRRSLRGSRRLLGGLLLGCGGT
ncbi:DNA translocase ftsK [Streptomyces hygroscopicus subsp. jinggangensis 5008]|nr:DNA translocase ftsK [Streptomyces hygroscopicus subsp. jinggangensis 5008]AGF66262.1 DNA translocase ftsK [Streptomyces hygroscopicus subsp. jinggangensis TL01]